MIDVPTPERSSHQSSVLALASIVFHLLGRRIMSKTGFFFYKRNEMYEANQTRAQDLTLKSSSEIWQNGCN